MAGHRPQKPVPHMKKAPAQAHGAGRPSRAMSFVSPARAPACAELRSSCARAHADDQRSVVTHTLRPAPPFPQIPAIAPTRSRECTTCARVHDVDAAPMSCVRAQVVHSASGQPGIRIPKLRRRAARECADSAARSPQRMIRHPVVPRIQSSRDFSSRRTCSSDRPERMVSSRYFASPSHSPNVSMSLSPRSTKYQPPSGAATGT